MVESTIIKQKASKFIFITVSYLVLIGCAIYYTNFYVDSNETTVDLEEEQFDLTTYEIDELTKELTYLDKMINEGIIVIDLETALSKVNESYDLEIIHSDLITSRAALVTHNQNLTEMEVKYGTDTSYFQIEVDSTQEELDRYLFLLEQARLG